MDLRIQMRRAEDLQWFSPMHDPEFADALRTYGLVVVEENPDVVFQDQAFDDVPHPKTIIFDRFDASTTTKNTIAKHDPNANVIGYMLPLRSTGVSIAPKVWGEGFTSKPVGVITTMLWQQLANPVFADETHVKEYDVSFAGTMKYPHKFTMEHRRKLLCNWDQLARWNTVGQFGMVPRVLAWEDAYRLSARSRVVISPWGICEVSWRDYEVVLGRAMMVKPRQPMMDLTSNPWVFNNVVYCSPDFTDLGDAVAQALDEYDEERLNWAREEILRVGLNRNELAMEFANQVRQIYDHIPKLPHTQQNLHTKEAFMRMIIERPPDRILEIGSGQGGLSAWLSGVLPWVEVSTWDIEDKATAPPAGGKLRRFIGDWRTAGLPGRINQEGRTWLLCDNGAKEEEASTLWPHLKSGDVMFVHDYFEDENDFEQARRERIWDWWECNGVMLYGIVEDANRLLKDELRKAAWACWEKP